MEIILTLHHNLFMFVGCCFSCFTDAQVEEKDDAVAEIGQGIEAQELIERVAGQRDEEDYLYTVAENGKHN